MLASGHGSSCSGAQANLAKEGCQCRGATLMQRWTICAPRLLRPQNTTMAALIRHRYATGGWRCRERPCSDTRVRVTSSADQCHRRHQIQNSNPRDQHVGCAAW